MEKLYISFPFFLFINPTYAGQLLYPLLESQTSLLSSELYAARELGESRTVLMLFTFGVLITGYKGQAFPQADARSIKHQQPVERTYPQCDLNLHLTSIF